MAVRFGKFGCVTTLLVLTVISVSLVESTKIASFNIQVFGKSKSSKPEVMDTLVKIISRYDLVLIQEIRDSSGVAISALLEQVNLKNTGNPFKMTISDRLGRTTSKEQYAFFYRKEFHVTTQYTFEDGDEAKNTENVTVDTFEREPYIVLFRCSSTIMKHFAIAGIHVAPDHAVEEIAALGDVFADIKTRLNIDDIMVMGDLNADCSYVPKKDWQNIPIKHDTAYSWLINDEEDTTVSGTDCAYDRFIVTGPGFSSAEDGGLVPGSVRVFKFDAAYGLSQEEAKAVSDHYPIELELRDVDTSGATGTVPSVLVALAMAAFVCMLLRL